jgi:hypothetical protein
VKTRLFLCLVLLASLIAAAPATKDSTKTAPPVERPVPLAPDTNWVFNLIAGSRLYPDWKEEHSVKLGETFYLGDTPFHAQVARFCPDFGIAEGKVENWSLAMNNPAVHVFVYSDSGTVDSAWAFKNFPPHFSPKSFFTFQLKDVQGYPPKKAAKASGKKEK